MSLKTYRKKRSFNKTAEPFGKKHRNAKGLKYVIQKHAASHLHYDFRLELNGVLKSWAVPKGPSLDPAVKRLAVHVEDHPIEYGSFQGIIPEGQYGAGTVKIWDKGEWICENKNPMRAYKKGDLTFSLKGKKLHGLWKLIQIKKDPKNWLLIKINDKYAQPDADMPSLIRPQLATLVKKPPEGDKWLHEVKFDGYRLITYIDNENIRFLTRNGNDWTDKFPDLKKAVKKLKISKAILDGELVAINKEKQFDFQLLQNSIHSDDASSLYYYVFDILYYNGQNLLNTPLIERKDILKELLSAFNKSIIKYSDHVAGNGDIVFKEACKKGLEGIISKQAHSLYVQERSRSWLKEKCVNRQEFVIGGYTKPKGERKHFGSLLIGFHAGKKLVYCGHVGTGFTEESIKMISKFLAKNKIDSNPFSSRPPDIKNVTWVNPVLIAEVEFRGWTKDKILRHASFKGLRKDKSPDEIIMEKPMAIKKSKVSSKKSHTSTFLTSPTKILYPEEAITKQEVADYYEAIHKWILPYIINRPLTLLRCPEGIDKKCFYQKHLADNKIEAIFTINVKEKNKIDNYFYIKNKHGLLSLVQLSALEIHPWGSKIDNIEKPDMIIFDLDPAPNVEWERIVEAARLIRQELKKLNLISFVKTTGGKGLHVVVPIKRQYTWEEIKAFSHVFVKYLVSLKPKDFIGVMTKSKRKGKIFIDYLRNQRGATAIAPYSTRAKDGATVSVPLSWNELSSNIRSDSFTIKNLPARLKKLKSDPWKTFLRLRQSLKFLKG